MVISNDIGWMATWIAYTHSYLSIGQTATPAPIPGQVLPIETVMSQAPAYVTTVYVGNLPPNLTQEEIAPVFGQFGIVHEIKMQADRGFAFVK